jgi:leucine dehydrogenase
MGRFIDSLGGRYIGAEDSGTKVQDLKIMATETAHVAGIVDKAAADGATRSGDPSPATAHGVFVGLKAAVKHQLKRDNLEGLRVAIQGVGNVGFRLGKYLHEAGAEIWVTDIHEDQVQQAVETLGATAVGAEQIFGLDVDVFAPCALGAVINADTLPQLQARIIAGAANNQLALPQHGNDLMDRGILYAPDYVINAGGIIDIYYERTGHDRERLLEHLDGIHDTLLEIFERASSQGQPTSIVADQIAEERLR